MAAVTPVLPRTILYVMREGHPMAERVRPSYSSFHEHSGLGDNRRMTLLRNEHPKVAG